MASTAAKVEINFKIINKMALRKYKPTTAGTRWRIGNAYAEITTNVPEKSLVEKQNNTAGRNAQGRRSMRYMGGGNKINVPYC